MRFAIALAVLVVRAFTVPLIHSSQPKANLTVPLIPKLFTLNKLFNENRKSHSGAAGELESVPYETINDKKRLYPSAKYVCTAGRSKVHKRRGVKDGKMFNKLFAYIDGHNNESQKIEMTVPVITKMSVPVHDNAPVTKTMCFYIPEKFQENPPTPNNQEVSILMINETVFFVKTFMGLSFTDTISDSVWINVKETFRQEMEDMDMADKVYQNHFYTAVYDFPMNSGSKYEVMLEEKSTDANVTTGDESEKLPRSVMLPTGDCPDGWEDIGGVNCYKFFHRAYVTWVEARNACLNEVGSDGYNANLASVHSQAEADLLAARVTSMNNPWIGMVWYKGSLVWTDGSALDFENWELGEPNNWRGTEDCVQVNTLSGNWNDKGCYHDYDYICMTSKRQRCAGRNINGRRCCTPQNPCGYGEGDCDGPQDGGANDGHQGCQGDLVCGSNNCMKFGTYYHEKDDCCDLPETLVTPETLGLEPPPGQRCAGRIYNGRRCCTPEAPCDEGEGDCDGPGDGGSNDGHRGCKGDLVCGSNNCLQFGAYYHEMDDCCERPQVTTGVPLEPPAGQRCAGRNYNGKRCCTPEAPCDEGEGDCDGPGDGGNNDGHRGCKGDLVCGSNNCLQFGAYYHEKDDCCERPLVQAAVPLEPTEGQRCAGRNYNGKRCCTPEAPCDEGEGDCDGPGDGGNNDGHRGCKGDLVCGSNNCLQFGAYYHEKDDCCERPQANTLVGGTGSGIVRQKQFGWGAWSNWTPCMRMHQQIPGRCRKTRTRKCVSNECGSSLQHTEELQEQYCLESDC